MKNGTGTPWTNEPTRGGRMGPNPFTLTTKSVQSALRSQARSLPRRLLFFIVVFFILIVGVVHQTNQSGLRRNTNILSDMFFLVLLIIPTTRMYSSRSVVNNPSPTAPYLHHWCGRERNRLDRRRWAAVWSDCCCCWECSSFNVVPSTIGGTCQNAQSREWMCCYAPMTRRLYSEMLVGPTFLGFHVFPVTVGEVVLDSTLLDSLSFIVVVVIVEP